MTELSPCPFCGSANLRCYEFVGSQGYICCDDCGTQGPCDEQAADPHCSIEAAEAAWNRRATVARLEHAPQPIPLSERLPGEEDCDAEGRCWVWNPEMYWWELCPLRLITINAGDPYDYWLPHWAIPTPQEQP